MTIDYTQKVQSIKQDDDSQERMERRPLGLLQARLQSMVLVAPLAGETLSIFASNIQLYNQDGLRAATTMGRVTLVTAAATTVTGLPWARMLKNMIGLERFLSLSGLPDPTR